MSTLPETDGSGLRRGLLLLDFDGTLWRGDEPLHAYAEATARALAPQDRDPFLARSRAFLAGERWGILGDGPLPDDGWAAVARFAVQYGATDEQRQQAFLETRARIAAGEFRMEVPAGLPEALAWSRTWCAVVLASNSPPSSVLPVLERLELTALFDDVACEAHKPTGLIPLGEAWMARYHTDPRLVMSIGDHYTNDIAPAVAAGWSTAYINPWRAVAGPCSVVGASVEEILPIVRAWVTTLVAGAPGARGGGDRSRRG